MRYLAVFMSISLLSACASPPSSEVKSHALTIAEQTYLTKDHKILWSTYESPLKDYSQDDLAEIKKAFEKGSPGKTSITFGLLSVLSGNLTGAIDIAGGAASNIAKSPHAASHSNWVVALPKNSASTGLEARNIANHTIQSTAIELLKEYQIHLTKVTVKEQREATFGATIYPETVYRIDGTEIPFGFYEQEFYGEKEKFGLVEGKSSLISAQEQYVTSAETVFSGVDGFNREYFVKNDIKPFNQEDGFDLYLKELTKRLPDGYMFYMSPRDAKDLIPALYIKGEKHPFIKPGS